MPAVVRTLVVDRVEPGLSDPGRVHAVLAARADGPSDVVHLWTSDPDVIAVLVPGAAFALSAAPADPLAGRCASCRWRSDEPAFRGDATAKGCSNPALDAEPMAEPGACWGGIAVSPMFGCVQWEAKSSP